MSGLSALGDRAWVAALPEGADLRELFARLRALPHVEDVVITEERVAVYGAIPKSSLADVEAALRAPPGAAGATEPVTHTIRVRYDGEDLAEVARATSRSEASIIELHTSTTFDVAMMGFSPGFAYLRSLPQELRLPRRAVPRVRVPAGAVAIAAHYTGIYPFAASGGWNIIGRVVEFVPWDPVCGAALAIGDRVRFERAT
jgi:KipI family sensor histidine kinase inhibitor